MAQCPKSIKETGLTGVFKFRKQRITGLPVLQVQTIIGMTQYPDDPPKFLFHGWRDATMDEATEVAYRRYFSGK